MSEYYVNITKIIQVITGRLISVVNTRSGLKNQRGSMSRHNYFLSCNA
jgi:hypothetical protein